MRRIFVEAKNLICADGEVWLWKSESMDGVRHFATTDDAQKYIDLHHQFSRESGLEEKVYSIGTAADFIAAKKKHEADKKDNEVKEYCKHVDALIERSQLEIKALDGLAQLCRKFDGKVINKRFHDAVKEATGLYSSFNHNLDRYEVEYFGCFYNCGTKPYIYIRADWSHGYNRYTGKKKEIDPNVWQWDTGDRLEAEKAIVVIEHYKNYRLETIENLKASKKKYAAYLRLARKAEQIFKDMQQYNNEIQEFARTHALSKYHCLSNLWLSY